MSEENRDRTFGITLIVIILIVLLSGCTGTYYLTDTKYERTSIVYYDNQIYSGWNDGYYYYYGIPHYYPWTYYYNTCPPSHYTHTTHVVITRPVNRPTHRPNRPNRPNNTYIRTNSITKVKTNTNYTRPNNTKVKNNIKVKTNRNNTRTKVNHRKPK